MSDSTRASDPLLDPSDLPCELPRFADIDVEMFGPAIERAMAEQLEAIDAIVDDPAEPTFENTLAALERTSVRPRRVLRIFSNLASADSNERIDALDAEFSPRLAAHHDAIVLNPGLWERLCAVQERGEDLDPEAAYLLERCVRRFRRAGAALPEAGKERLRALNTRISELETAFKIELQNDTNELAVVVDDVNELDGLTEGEISAAASAAASRGLEGAYLLTLVLPTPHPYLASLTSPQMRERLSRAQRSRGARGNAHDTRSILLELVRLRAERAQLLGYTSHADYVISDTTAGSADAARDLLVRLSGPAAANARAEEKRLEQEAGGPIRASDWPYWAERVRSVEHDVDLASLRSYFELERVLHDGVFFAASTLFGLSFAERSDLKGYHPDVRVFEVREADGSVAGLYLLDPYARDSKRGGAWMSSFVSRASLTGSDSAVILNVLNVPKPASGPTLLTWTEVTTLFHEFGHALHGLLARVRFPSFAGTAVPPDFVEFPSQVNEMWMTWPEVLESYAVHVETGEPIPADVVERIRAAETFNEGYATSEYLAASVIDLAWHSLTPDEVPESVDEIPAFEQAALAAVGLDNPAVPTRYASPYFAHIFAGGYAAGYYSYIWAEVLDADTADWYAANGGLRRENGEQYREHVIGFGGTRDPLAAYVEWRGRPAPIEPLLKRRGLAGASA